MNIKIILIFIVVYCICMVNPAIIICKAKNKTDIRRIGSMDAGTNNAFKILGVLLGIIVVLLNVLKVLLAMYVAKLLANLVQVDTASSIYKSTVILGTMIGHCYPFLYKFNGGKGIIEFITLMSVLDYKYVLVCVIVSALIVIVTRILVKGTLAGCVLYLILSVVIGCEYIPALVISLAIILLRHKENLHRIKYKQEEKI